MAGHSVPYYDDEFITPDEGDGSGVRDFAADMGYDDAAAGTTPGGALLGRTFGSVHPLQPSAAAAAAAAAAATAAAQQQRANALEAAAVDDGSKPHILLFGLKRSGKSSILKVVFNKMSPHETRHLESTKAIEKSDVSSASFIKFEVWDFPGQLDWDPSFDDGAIFGPCGALIWVCDAQEDYSESLRRFLQTVARAHVVNPGIMFEFFIHKCDGLSDDHRVEVQRDVIRACHDSLHEVGLDGVQITTHLTSIYDHSIFDAFSKVVQKMTPQLGTLECLLDGFTASSQVERAFLADIATKIYLVSDQSHVDMFNYELCSEMIDVVTDILGIYSAGAVAAAAASATPAGEEEGEEDEDEDEDDDADDDDPGVESTIRLTDGMVLWLRTVNKFLVLVCLVRDANFSKRGLIEYNFDCLKKALREILALQLQGIDGIPAAPQPQADLAPAISAPIPMR